MKILFACIPTPLNRFMVDLKEGLEQHAEVVWDCDEFWAMKNDYDVIHIHWPEYLSFEMESYLRTPESIPSELWERLKTCLDFWSAHSKIIYTRHVQYPHARHDEEFLNLYRFVTSYCDTVVHFANYSIEQFKEFYPEHEHVNHVVIPHHNYASLPNPSDKRSARKELGIAEEDHVMLVFGAIKDNEKELISKAFSYLPGNNKVLLAPGWKVLRREIGYIRLREWIWKWDKWIASKQKRKRINLGFIAEEDAHLYLNSADFLFIPRTNELNSGNITLGCTFGLVVVGKDGADIGEILEETGNPTFKVDNDDSLRKAVLKALELKNVGHGAKNRKLALDDWGINLISNEYLSVMKGIK
ncbi:glycosyltransferase [Mangrovimonas sp. ST2L15]|uniref:glycosyltransferase n=1 Tax=Mangrovimonas sp. ST2L15 TaxID=1645916 RepID=UPI0006B47757|nr:glycosyltransferase [Mangrovimonas sp. ST2L15]